MMKEAGLDAYIVFSNDPHMSEYVPERWKAREFISGFSGSAGTFLLTLEESALWTDGRYFLQAEQELAGTEIILMKIGVSQTPDMLDWLAERLAAGARIGTDASCISWRQVQQLTADSQRRGLLFQAGGDLLGSVWPGRPDFPSAPVYEFPASAAGESRAERLGRFSAALRALGANATLVSTLDDIAYLLLMRGADIDCNPLALSFLLFTANEMSLFLPENKHASAQFLCDDGIKLYPYQDVYAAVQSLPADCQLLIDPDRSNMALVQAILAGRGKKSERDLLTAVLPSVLMKACKNKLEADGLRETLRLDSTAVWRFLHWLKDHPKLDSLTELDAADHLQRLRSQIPGYIGESFPTIAGFGANAAVIHYSARLETTARLHPDGLFLVDSGAHYCRGTSDITRVLCWNAPKTSMRRDYTLVLKGHIALARCIFPAGTRGVQLDAFARQYLWQYGYDYLHGTGHGVGFCLPVHEGPQSISTKMIDEPLRVGMLVSNEPGLYRSGEYGIRIENLMMVVPAAEGDFLCFEMLSYCPLERDLILPDLLRPDELDWIDAYHQECIRRIGLLLDAHERPALEKWAAPLDYSEKAIGKG